MSFGLPIHCMPIDAASAMKAARIAAATRLLRRLVPVMGDDGTLILVPEKRCNKFSPDDEQLQLLNYNRVQLQ